MYNASYHIRRPIMKQTTLYNHLTILGGIFVVLLFCAAILGWIVNMNAILEMPSIFCTEGLVRILCAISAPVAFVWACKKAN
jgi:hypothetical protein